LILSWQERLHAYLGGVIGTLGGVPCIVGGTVDHVHLLVGLRASHRLSDVICGICKMEPPPLWGECSGGGVPVACATG